MAFSGGDPYGTGFYDPTSSYGGTRYAPGQFATTPVGGQYLEDNQPAAYARYLREQGVDEFSGLGTFAARMFPSVKTGYLSALATNPFLRFAGPGGYLGQFNLFDLYRRLTPQQRGEPGQSQYAPLDLRWIPR